MVWTALRTGIIPFESASAAPASLSAKQWIDLVLWVSKHIDGGLRPADSAPTSSTSTRGGDSDSSGVDDNMPTFTLTETTAVDRSDPLVDADSTVASPQDEAAATDPTDALPELNAYLAQIAADSAAAAPIRPHIPIPAPAQVSNPELAYRLLMQAREARLAKQGQGSSSSEL
jgi:hypothetical protein